MKDWWLLIITAITSATLSSSTVIGLFKNIPVSNITVFNAFTDQEVLATVRFGKSVQNQMNQIGYGSHKTVSLSSSSEDYIIRFIKLPTGGIHYLYSQLSSQQ